MRFEVKGNRQITKNDYVQHSFILIVFEASFHLIFTEILWNTIKVHINRIRNRFPDYPFEIKTVRGLGYKAVKKDEW